MAFQRFAEQLVMSEGTQGNTNMLQMFLTDYEDIVQKVAGHSQAQIP